jgi:hypothetical protein
MQKIKAKMKRFKINPHNQTQKSGGRTMKKKVLSVVMAAAMMTSVFSATAVTASAADAEELTIWVHETDSPEGQLYLIRNMRELIMQL